MKKMGFIVALCMVLVLAACGGGGNSVGNTAAPVQETPTANSSGSNAETPAATGSGGSLESLSLTMPGGSAGGFFSLVGNGVGNVLMQEIPNVQFAYEPSNTVANVVRVAQGDFPIGMAWAMEAQAALNGSDPYKEKVAEVYALVSLFNNAQVQIIVSKAFADKYDVHSMEDLVAKKPPVRLTFNQKGNLLHNLNVTIFEAYDITEADINAWGGMVLLQPHKESLDLLKDNKLDIVASSIFAPDGKILETTTTTEVEMWSINQKAQQLTRERYSQKPGVIKAGTYEWQTTDVNTVNGGALLLADPNLPEDAAYTITKSIVENLEMYKQVHTNLQALTVEDLADVTPAKLHPGAEKYFKEIGIIK